MQLHTLWADRGEALDHIGQDDPVPRARLAAVSRSASLGVADGHGAFWLVLRGSAQLECREGRFRLQAGDWIAVDRDSRPTLLGGRRTLVLALLLPAAGASALEQPDLPALHPGRGRLNRRQMRLALQLWRRHASVARAHSGEDVGGSLRTIVHFLASLQAGLDHFVDRCPGRSLRRKRQVFARMQRARLYLDGNLGHPVRLAELAQLCNFSVWYFTKTFHALYEEGPREAIARTRLRQASELLEQTSLSVGEVGAACGFENPCSFARAFRAHYGTTASGYRAKRCTGASPSRAQRTGSRAQAIAMGEP
ncbi:MAG TPA: helix-turn-helix transcriptional regulator [Xanthomonadaceae bacterium]|nr:helix-turn-helix transcriptional regulator [Xanthomonadaceae bacterium]